ncbi:basic phospholipase A2-like [Pomacea canaliculata]|uniref:basic phospholipase A2-like n=1 Tax=Pomacea canaliculata TaxID=400727 RepID=UPI000D733589|nr:basic phospholipase A2-like [Pomacea canaliculata]XP_025099474.1 basic phospholipase A2-like [Pomacea canaliculata]XP_025099475.1 basic phospholipase A2-like [Pomacea canaliculata]XP_025099476.1 basic phospholipase A2-like [Pomacea canaliculata]
MALRLIFVGITLVFIVYSLGAVVPSGHRSRTKRTLLQACELIRVHTNRGCFDYYQYGCFCGLGNAGTQEPLDDVDECCRQHDRCYGQVTCLWFYPQFVGFDYTCTENGTCTCTDDQLWSPCARSVCDCELTFAQCLGNARYNGQLRNYDWRQCVSHEQPHLSSP